jgi:hypothetical protein
LVSSVKINVLKAGKKKEQSEWEERSGSGRTAGVAASEAEVSKSV